MEVLLNGRKKRKHRKKRQADVCQRPYREA